VPYLPILMYLSRSSLMMRNRNPGFGYLLPVGEGGGGRELLFGRYPLNISHVLSFSLMSISLYYRDGRRNDWERRRDARYRELWT
jgi:hypothetical protein